MSAALLVAGAFLSVGSAMSALTKQPGDRLRARPSRCASCSPSPPTRWSPTSCRATRRRSAEIARRIAVIDRFQDFTRGIVSLRDLIFFATFIGFWLFLNTVLVDQRKAD